VRCNCVKQCKASQRGVNSAVWLIQVSQEKDMTKTTQFNPERRNALKVAAGFTVATGVLATQVAADPLFDDPADRADGTAEGVIVDCKLICRDTASRAYILMHNKTDTDIAANRFSDQNIRFDDTTLNLKEAFTSPIIIRSQDRMMVRLNLDSGAQVPFGDVIDLNAATSYLPLGTRIVDLRVRLHRGKGTIDRRAISLA